jgi:hypothetical protein
MVLVRQRRPDPGRGWLIAVAIVILVGVGVVIGVGRLGVELLFPFLRLEFFV